MRIAIASSTPGSQSIMKRRAGEGGAEAEGVEAADMSAREERRGARPGRRSAWAARYRNAASVLACVQCMVRCWVGCVLGGVWV